MKGAINYETKEKKIFQENIFLHMVFEVKDRIFLIDIKEYKKVKRSLVFHMMNSSSSRVEENEFAKTLQRNKRK